MFQENQIIGKEKYKIKKNREYDFYQLDPIPSSEELSEFYQKKYYHLIKEGGRAPELRRQMAGGEEVKKEKSWLVDTLYNDVNYYLERFANKQQFLLDVGCGTGQLIGWLKQFGWNVLGIEPFEEIDEVSLSDGIQIFTEEFDQFVKNHSEYAGQISAVTLMSVLEHVPDPVAFIELAKKLLMPKEGVLCIRVPNDFNELQYYAEKAINKSAWWVAAPDHINYFSIESLQQLLEKLGFEILHTTVDFPMELFLLMGEDYVGNPDLGSDCHKKRVDFEMGISDELRRKFYSSISNIGLGRNLMLFARVK